jgi:hypothetical protein
MIKDPRLIRLDATRLKIVNDQDVDATLFANEQVPVAELTPLMTVKG